MGNLRSLARRKMRVFLIGKTSPIWDGVFQDFNSAKISVPSNLKTDYESDYEIDKRIELELNREKIFDSFNPTFARGTQRFNVLSVFLSSHQGQIRILDMGGAGGSLFHAMHQQLGHAEIEILIYEYEGFVNKVKNFLVRSKLNIPKLSWTSNIPNQESFKVLYFGSSLQYFEDWKQLISNLVTANNFEYLVVSDTLLNPKSSFVTLQLNMPGRAIPYMVVGVEDLTEHMEKNGFVKILQNQNDVVNHTFNNFEYPFNQTRNQNLIYRNMDFREPF